ncbi:hypothetical protein ABE547_09535 [Dorea sp. YH-dor226]|uniref:hypothetical protein n=1 Tax=Dorea sp. YH-dor226 TaxID=3151119 RepID=UPI003241EA71
MKRVKAACICQTLHFMLKEDVGHDYAVDLVKHEVEQYKKDWSDIIHSIRSSKRRNSQMDLL